MKYGIHPGQIYQAADGSRAGHRIDAFKLAMVRYTLATVAPDWMPPSETQSA